MRRFQILSVTILLFVYFISGCGNSKKELSFKAIPQYPASTPEQSMEGSGFAGMVGGELKQFSTTDPFNAVVEFYSGELDKYNPETISHTSELGRQTAITIKQEKKVITIAIQEHKEEGRVMITHMAVGSK